MHPYRLRILSVFIILFALLVVAKLYLVQIVSGDIYKAKAEGQYTVGVNYFDRGNIFFSTKEGNLVPAASVKTGFLLYINPNILNTREDLEEIYTNLNTIVSLDKETFLTRARKQNDTYEELAKRLTREQAEAVQELKVPGVAVAGEKWRVYPGDSIASHTVGLMGFSGDEFAGRYGLERYYENVLERSGEAAFNNFFVETFSNIKKAISEDESLEGDIVTHIEPSVQTFLESELKKINERYSSDFSGGIIIDPKTGAIYAMALDPSFNPNSPQSERSSSIFSNKLVEDRYEMGSILKAFTLAIGLDTGAITAKSTYNDPGCMTLNSKKFCNYDGKSHGSSVSMQTVLSKSLNTGSAWIVTRVGGAEFSKRMLAFGLGEKTGIDLPNEGASLVANLKTTRELELAQASFGQGVALTPIITVRALSALANGGTLIEPHLTKEIKYKLGTTKTLKHPKASEAPRVLSPDASAEISRMLTESVDRYLREGTMRLENYNIAAKTGTAQIASPAGGYYSDRYLHSFFGYFPSYDPRFLVFLYTYDPKDSQFASETLTDAFFNNTKFLINYYSIPPDREKAPEKVGG